MIEVGCLVPPCRNMNHNQELSWRHTAGSKFAVNVSGNLDKSIFSLIETNIYWVESAQVASTWGKNVVMVLLWQREMNISLVKL